MKTLFSVVALSLLAGTVARSAPFTVETHTAADSGFAVNSHLVLGKQEAILIDAQFTRSEARQVSEMVRQSGRRLTTIFITHGHPDHYFGLEVLSRDFPGARVLATRDVIRDIEATGRAKLAYWKPIYKDDLTDAIVMPEELKGGSLELEGQILPVTELVPGESEHAAVIYLPVLKTLVAGDLAYHQVHLWLAENRPDGWLANLRTIGEVGVIERVLPGHGAPGSTQILEEDRRYIESFVTLTAPPATQTQALAGLKRLYPACRLPVIAELSVKARVK